MLPIPRKEDLFFPLEQTFDKFFQNSLSKNSGYPKMNVFESDGKFVVVLSVSGVSKENIDVYIDSNNFLIIKGKASSEHRSPDNCKYHIRELKQSAFERVIGLPDGVSGDPEATLKDGMLKLVWDVSIKKDVGVRRIDLKD